MGLRFQHIGFSLLFAGLLVAIILFFLLLRWKKKTSNRIGDKGLVKELIASYSPTLFTVKFGFLSIAFAAGILAVMNLRKPANAEGINRKGIDVVIALDVSKSMLATDIAPSRLERAKQLINRLMSAMPDDRIGLVFFAGKAYLQMPLTTDHGAAWMYVSSAGPGSVPYQGTAISEALRRSATAFNAAERRFKAVIVISDGEDHDKEAVTTARQLAEEGVMINTVGIGSPSGTVIFDSLTGQNMKDETGADVISRLNEEDLQAIAKHTNGVYAHLKDSEAVVHALREHLAQIEAKAYGDVSLMNFKTYYWWFAGVMLLLLLIEIFLPENRKIKK